MLTKFEIDESKADKRLDKELVVYFSDRSRQYLQKIIKQGCVLINGKVAKSSAILKIGDKIEVNFPAVKELDLKAADIKLQIVYEDKDLLVVNKAAGMVVHPGTGSSHQEDSLVNALLYHCKGNLSGIGGVQRPGIVHRLDKDTSGLLVVAKNDKAHQHLAKQFKDHQVTKIYFALVAGKLQPLTGTIDAPIGRHGYDRKKMAITNEAHGRQAVTKYKVLEQIGEYSLLEITLITGRTHQIRVHFAAIGFPLVGDIIYGRPKVNKFFEQNFGLKRVFLHAGKLGFMLPDGGLDTGKKVSFEAELPKDLQDALDGLREGV